MSVHAAAYYCSWPKMEAYSRGPGLGVTRLDAALQLARSKVPVLSLTVVEPPAKWVDRGHGWLKYGGYPPGAVAHKVRTLSRPALQATSGDSAATALSPEHQ
jgi:hypothetical protein